MQVSSISNCQMYHHNFKANSKSFKLNVANGCKVDQKALEKYAGANVDIVKMFDELNEKIDNLSQNNNLIEYVVNNKGNKYSIFRDKNGNDLAKISDEFIEIKRNNDVYRKISNGEFTKYFAGDGKYLVCYDEAGSVLFAWEGK